MYIQEQNGLGMLQMAQESCHFGLRRRAVSETTSCIFFLKQEPVFSNSAHGAPHTTLDPSTPKTLANMTSGAGFYMHPTYGITLRTKIQEGANWFFHTPTYWGTNDLHVGSLDEVNNPGSGMVDGQWAFSALSWKFVSY